MKIYIDLLPEQRKQKIREKKVFHNILCGEVLFSLPILIFICMLLSAYYLLIMQRNISNDLYSMQQTQNEYRELNMYEEKFKEANEIDSFLIKIQNGHLRWKNVFIELSKITPREVYMNNISTKDFKIFLAGKSKSRDDLISFKNNLENSFCFQEINVPLSNLVVKSDIDFQIDLTIKKDCLGLKSK